MQKTFTLLLAVVAAFCVSISANAQDVNLYPENISGFEINFFTNSNPQPADAFTGETSTERKFDGLQSLRFQAPDASVPTGGNANGIMGGTNEDFDEGNISVAAGMHTWRAMVYIEGAAPNNVVVYLTEKETGIVMGKTLIIPLTDVVKDSWQRVSAEVTFDAAMEIKTGIRMRGFDYAGPADSSTVYIDHLELFEGTPTATRDVPNGPKFTVYPNPVTESLVFSTVEQVLDLTIFNTTGQPVRKISRISGTRTVSVADLPPGHYILRATGRSGVTTSRQLIKL